MPERRRQRAASPGPPGPGDASSGSASPGEARLAPAGVSRNEVVALSELLVRLVLASRAADRVRPTEGGDLSPHTVRATMYLFRHGQATVGELAEGLGVSVGWASRIADELERAGRVVRERDPLDRRVVRLRLSPTAAALAEDVYLERGGLVAHALADLHPQERAAVTRFLRRLIGELETLTDRGP